ncbi:uncharacterized protein [Littorina saxatilis]|uniref:uncharacterized protein n=1 Tax=Littorina saxatilis TaxID=31220 RepID=UPI0038B4BF2D
MGVTTAVMLMLIATHTHAWSSKKVCKYDEWLNKPCLAQADCKVKMAECFKGRCLCTPGYYYSISGNTCVEECSPSNLADGFLVYLDSYLRSDTWFEQYSGVCEQQCAERCAAEQRCRTFVAGGDCYFGYGLCELYAITPVEAPEDFVIVSSSNEDDEDYSFAFYQRKCA